jgi:uncharacterized protein (DUF885 family)
MLADEVLPHGRSVDRGGLCWLPGGEAAYAGLVRSHTTTTRPAEEWHDIGQAQIAALTEQYAEIGGRALGTTDLHEIFGRLRTDAGFRWRDGEQMLAAARDAIRRAEEAAPGWFGRLPAQGCTVEPVLAELAPGIAAAYY